MIELDNFVQGYIDCALWCEVDENETPLDTNYTSNDIPSLVAAEIINDCLVFINDNRESLEAASIVRPWDHLGHDYYLTRNGHGTGFWDRNELEVNDLGKKLSEACRHKEKHLQFSDGNFYYE